MLTRPLGESGIEASVVGLGTWAIGGWCWGGNAEKESIEAIHAAIDHGMNLIDTAPMYGMGRSEEILGKALRGSIRQKAIVATKCGLVWDGSGEDGSFLFGADEQGKTDLANPNPKYKVFRNNRPHHIRRGVEESLRRLRTDVIDLFQTHWQDATTPIAETMHELMRLKKEGKIRAIGVSNATPDELTEYRAAGQLDTDQEKYGMLDRKHEEDNLPYCEKNNIAFLAYSPLAKGLLTGKVGPDRLFAPGDQRNVDPRFSLENRIAIGRFLEAIRPVADDYKLTLAQLVTAWTFSRPGCSHVLLGARNARQVAENAGAGAARLDAAALELIARAMEEHLRGVV